MSGHERPICPWSKVTEPQSTEPAGLRGGVALDTRADGLDDELSASRVMTVAPPGRSSLASAAMIRSVLCIQSVIAR